MDLLLRDLTPALLPDWLAFFDRDAFADNPDWGGCYCRAMLFEGGMDAWDAACASGENRAAMSARIEAGRVTGLLAYDGERAVGWCQFGARSGFRPLPGRLVPIEEPTSVGSIVCFVVAEPYRRKGVATSLLRAACDALARTGLAVAEAYPHRDEAEHHRFAGPLAMYLAEGFTVAGETPRSLVVRKTLRPDPAPERSMP